MGSIFGIDTSGPASKLLATKASPWTGGLPRFWGRYFNGTSAKTYQYSSSENSVLNQLGIPVLCFARQMKEVHDPALAKAHAAKNIQGVIDAFGAQYLLEQRISPLIFLDLEPESVTAKYIMHQDYYKQWSAAIVAGVKVGAEAIRFRPAVYLNDGDSQQSWLNLNAACVGGAACEGVSVARYTHNKYLNPSAHDSLIWNDERLAPSPNPIPPGHPNAHLPVLVWQYHGDYLSVKLPDGKTRSGDIDFNMVNPAHESIVLSGLVPPPASASRAAVIPQVAFATIREQLASNTPIGSDVATLLNSDAAEARADRRKLTTLADELGLREAMSELLDFAFAATSAAAEALRFWIVVDFSRPSNERRFHVFDRIGNSVESLFVAHGSGSACKDDRNNACSFGNVPGSYKSSLGVYRCGDRFVEGEHLRMRVHGLQKGINDKAFARAILIHTSWYVSDRHVKTFGRCGCSEGCFVLDEKAIDRLVGQFSEGSFMIAVQDHK